LLLQGLWRLQFQQDPWHPSGQSAQYFLYHLLLLADQWHQLHLLHLKHLLIQLLPQDPQVLLVQMILGFLVGLGLAKVLPPLVA
jgi:hypothetical protein